MRKLDLKHWSSSISTLLGSRDKNVLQSYTKDHCQNHTYTLKDFHNYIRLEWARRVVRWRLNERGTLLVGGVNKDRGFNPQRGTASEDWKVVLTFFVRLFDGQQFHEQALNQSFTKAVPSGQKIYSFFFPQSTGEVVLTSPFRSPKSQMQYKKIMKYPAKI